MGASNNIGPENQPIYNILRTLYVSPAGVATQVGGVAGAACGLVLIRNRGTNANVVGVGSDNTITATNGLTLAVGESTPWIPIDNINKLWVFAAAGEVEVMYLQSTP